MALIHKHLLMKIRLRKSAMYLDDPAFWNAMVDELIVDVLKMKIAIPSRSVLVTDPDNFGVTGAANLTTSHISWHVWTAVYRPFIQMDVYSCQDFETKDVTDFLSRTLGDGVVGLIHTRVLDRNNDATYDEVVWNDV